MSYIDNVQRKIKIYIKNTYAYLQLDDMVMGKGLFNRQCHQNSIQKANEDDLDVYMAVSLHNDDDDNDVFIHFINKDKNNKYVDNTLGYQYKSYKYYIIRKININEYNKIFTIFLDYRKFLIDTQVGEFQRKVYNFFHNKKAENYI